MARYVLAYRGGSEPDGEAAQAAVMQAWMNWFGELGPAVVDGGAPFGGSSTVVAGGAATAGAPSALTGYSILSADSHADAERMAAGCPILADGGAVDVYEVHEMG
jgi:hypothetical protein